MTFGDVKATLRLLVLRGHNLSKDPKTKTFLVVSYGKTILKSRQTKNAQSPWYNDIFFLCLENVISDSIKIEVMSQSWLKKNKSLGYIFITNIDEYKNDITYMLTLPLEGIKTGDLSLKLQKNNYDAVLFHPQSNLSGFQKVDQTTSYTHKLYISLHKEDIFSVRLDSDNKIKYEAFHTLLPKSHITIRDFKNYQELLVMQEVLNGPSQNMFIIHDSFDAKISDCTYNVPGHMTKYWYKRYDSPDLLLAKGNHSKVKILRNGSKEIAWATRSIDEKTAQPIIQVHFNALNYILHLLAIILIFDKRIVDEQKSTRYRIQENNNISRIADEIFKIPLVL